MLKPSIEKRIKALLDDKGVDIVRFVDISHLPLKQNRGYKEAILMGILLSPNYLFKVSNTPDYVEKMKRERTSSEDEFNIKEQKTDQLADYIADYLVSEGYSAYSQSERNIESTGFYDSKGKITPLPHKTIAGLAGLGWIGKSNLLVTPKYGSAISMSSVLTGAPLETILFSPTTSGCGDCSICKDVCQVQAIKGKPWGAAVSRDEIIDVALCNTCLKCMVFCPWTQQYMKKQNQELTNGFPNAI